MNIKIIIVNICLHHIEYIQSDFNVDTEKKMAIHETVRDNETFPYVTAIMRKSKYISAGALIDENWILTGADSLYLIRESVRILRVRLGSVSYKEGGVIKRVKYVQIHPYFDDKKPQFDLALIKLSEPIKLNPRLNPIQLQRKQRNPNVRHFVVAGWATSTQKAVTDKDLNLDMDNHRLLTAKHLHPMAPEDCSDQLEAIGENRTNDILCLDLQPELDPCQRYIGAPVSLNGVLWGVISSWKSEDCDLEQDPIFVNLVSPIEVSSWIHSVVRGHRWSKKHTVDYKDNFI